MGNHESTRQPALHEGPLGCNPDTPPDILFIQGAQKDRVLEKDRAEMKVEHLVDRIVYCPVLNNDPVCGNYISGSVSAIFAVHEYGPVIRVFDDLQEDDEIVLVRKPR